MKIPITYGNEIINLISQEHFAKELLISARRAHQLNPGSKDAEKYNHVVFNVDRQLEVMAERLATLPQSISPTPIYKQMEKLEERKKEAQSKITELQSSGFIKDESSELQDFQRFLKAIGGLLQSDDNPKIRLKIIRFLVQKVYVIPDGFEAHFKVGESYVKIFLIKFENGEKQNKKAQMLLTAMDDNLGKKNALPGNASQFLGHFGSNTCQIGAREPEVEEPYFLEKIALIRSGLVLLVEFDCIAEPKALNPINLNQIVKKYGGCASAAKVMGASEAFVRQRSQKVKSTSIT